VQAGTAFDRFIRPGPQLNPAEDAHLGRIREIMQSDFEHGRIQEDPYVPRAVAGLRYRHWLDDLIAQKHEIYAYVLDGDVVGLHVQRRDGDAAHLVLTGVTRSHALLGLPLWAQVMRQLRAGEGGDFRGERADSESLSEPRVFLRRLSLRLSHSLRLTRGGRMHELALAEAVVTAAHETAKKNGLTKLTRIEVRVGELQQIEREAFQLAIEEMTEAAVDVQADPARFLCRRCGHVYGLADTPGFGGEDASEAIHFIPELAHAFLRCPACDSPDFTVTGGRGVTLGAIEGD
jgi:hydrogenase nickel incorporation protein HypA/HybF